MRRLPVPALPRVVRYGSVLLVAAVIAYFSLTGRPPRVPDAGPWWDKRLHLVAYAGLGLALAYATLDERRLWLRVAVILGAVFVYGSGIELVQWTLPRRYFGVGDILANLAGGVVATAWLALERVVRYVPLPSGVTVEES
ncbi:VanZ family protein [Halosegnis marinus]|uniref:VanZ family protein n=1 Tax=Halosegnis marinus TaxID=3034023 RepID=A0ABD5ZQT5_9EURY|nr:VanZ family protein [Halosegnis sp. DT85]